MHSRTVFLVVVFTVALASHYFVASWFMHAVPALRRHRRIVLGAAFALCALTALGRLGLLLSRSTVSVELVAAGLVEWMIVMIGAIPLAMARVALGALHGFWPRRASPADGTAAEPPPGTAAGMTRRQVVEGVAGTLALGASTAVLGLGSLRGRHAFEIEEVPVRIPGLPRVLDGYTIAQVSDIHAGIFVGDRELDEGLALVREIRPDLLVATGDLVDFDIRYAARLAAALARVAPRDGVFAVLGNHDYYAGARAVTREMKRAGLGLLVNEGRTIRPNDGGGFALLGVDDLWSARWDGAGPKLDDAIAMVEPDAPRILLAHQPPYFDSVAGRVALQLSGHTHGGQVNPGFRPADLFIRYLSGRYERKGSTLWVNRGFGVAGPPTRVGAPPKVTKIVLVAA
jgi:uncharacterized protein